jgi:hypothetical protein
MAKELLVTESLSKEMVEAGADLTRRLDLIPFKVRAAFWLFLPEQKTWRLVFAFPEVRTMGPKASYKKVQSALNKIPKDQPKIALRDITVTEPNDPLIKLLNVMISTGPGISEIRFSKNVINGQLIEDAYIYRMNMA